MATPALDLLPPLPTVTCPVCGARMRLATIQPRSMVTTSAVDSGSTITFDCACGFTYRQSDEARKELQP